MLKIGADDSRAKPLDSSRIGPRARHDFCFAGIASTMEALVRQNRPGAPLHPARGAPGRLNEETALPGLSSDPSDAKVRKGFLAGNAARPARNGAVIRFLKQQPRRRGASAEAAAWSCCRPERALLPATRLCCTASSGSVANL
jgi:hypothetical protein